MTWVPTQDTAKAEPVTGRWLRTPIAVWRLTRSVLHILWGVAQVLTVWDRLDARTRRERHLDWSMKMVRALGVKVTVLHEGSMLAEGTLDQVSADPRVVEVYLGR